MKCSVQMPDKMLLLVIVSHNSQKFETVR